MKAVDSLVPFIAACLVAGTLAVGMACSDKGGAPLKQTRDVPTFTVNLNLLPPAEVNQTCQKLGLPMTSDYNGCNGFNKDINVCTIYVSPQRYQQDAERLAVLGHEVWHCRYGVWHE